MPSDGYERNVLPEEVWWELAREMAEALGGTRGLLSQTCDDNKSWEPDNAE